MKRVAWIPITVLIVIIHAGALAAQESQTPQINTTRLAEGLFMLEGAGGNSVACVGEDGVVLVDTGYTSAAEALRAAVAELSDKPVRIVINTHWHLDHVDGNLAFASEGALVVAHENVRLHMSSDQHLAIIDRDVPASPAEALPALTFGEALHLHWGNEDISLFHLPSAHTDGDTAVCCSARPI